MTMRREEAVLLGEWIESLGLAPGAVCLNIGSSTRAFRESAQPHIARLFARVEAAGLRVIHCDMKADAGVDEVGDVFDPAYRARLKTYDAALLLCSNLLEHLTDPQGFADACGDLVAPGEHVILTVPHSYPWHPDPIDTMLRPTPGELAAFMPGWGVVQSTAITAGTHWRDMREKGLAPLRLAKQALRSLMPFYGHDEWRRTAHRLAWLARPYRQSMVMLRKPANDRRSPERADAL